jgi:PadR family transcriptional regulator PadR
MHRRLIKASWGVSENNRRARFYSLTPRGRQHLEERAETWQRLASVMERIFKQPAKESE